MLPVHSLLRPWFLAGTAGLLFLIFHLPHPAALPVGSQQPAISSPLPTVALHLPWVTQPAQVPSPTILATPSPTLLATATLPIAPTPTLSPAPTPVPIGTGDCTSIYPIGVDAALLGATDFLPPDRLEEQAFYVPTTHPQFGTHWQRRVYYRVPGFSFARWQSALHAGNNLALTQALTGTGTLAMGFDEFVPWPDRDIPPPSGYPLLPHRLSVGDWLYTFQDVSFGSPLQQTLRHHVQQHTLLLLPVITRRVGIGLNSSIQLGSFGVFLLNGYSTTGAEVGLDLVYIGIPEPTPCSSS